MLLVPTVPWRLPLSACLHRLTGERGASLVEYALLVALIAIVCFAALVTLGAQVNSTYVSIGSSLG